MNYFILKTFKILITDSKIENKIGRFRLFQETFLITNIKYEIILKMFFLKISNTDILVDRKIFI